MERAIYLQMLAELRYDCRSDLGKQSGDTMVEWTKTISHSQPPGRMLGRPSVSPPVFLAVGAPAARLQYDSWPALD